MDCLLKFKLVYLEWAEGLTEGVRVPLGNGLPPQIYSLLKQEFKHIPGDIYKLRSGINGFEEKYNLRNNAGAFTCSSLSRFHLDKAISIDEIKDDNYIYFLPVEIRGSVSNTMIGSRARIGIQDKEYDFNFFYDSIAQYPRILELLQSGKVKLLINNAHDPVSDVSMEEYKILEDNLQKLYKIDYRNMIYFSGNDITKLSVKVSSNIIFDEGNYYARHSSEQLLSLGVNFNGVYVSDYMRKEHLDVNVIRPFKFLSPNNNLINRINRLRLLYFAYKHDLFSEGMFSFLDRGFEEERYSDMSGIKNLYFPDCPEVDETTVKKLLSLLPHEGLDTKKYNSRDLHTAIYGPGQVKEWYEKTYLTLVTETSHRSNILFISEKTFRPIIQLQPFIMFGPGGILKAIRNLGFKTFDGFIDESYDDIEDDFERLRALEKEIIRFKNMTIKEVHDWYYSMTDILLYNQNHLRGFQDFDCFTPLFNKVYDLYVQK